MIRKAAKKRNPQDATLRNIRALNTRIHALEIYCRLLNRRLQRVELEPVNMLYTRRSRMVVRKVAK